MSDVIGFGGYWRTTLQAWASIYWTGNTRVPFDITSGICVSLIPGSTLCKCWCSS